MARNMLMSLFIHLGQVMRNKVRTATSCAQWFPKKEGRVEKNEIIKLLAFATYQLWSAALDNCMRNDSKFKALKDVQVGDLVMELSALAFRPDYIHAIGKLVNIEKKETECHDIYTIRTLFDGSLCNWSNCEFIRVPNGNKITRPFEREGNHNAQQHQPVSEPMHD